MVAKGSRQSAATKELCRVKAVAYWAKTTDRSMSLEQRAKISATKQRQRLERLAAAVPNRDAEVNTRPVPDIPAAEPLLPPSRVSNAYVEAAAYAEVMRLRSVLAQEAVDEALDFLEYQEYELEMVREEALQAQAEAYAVKLRYFGTRAA